MTLLTFPLLFLKYLFYLNVYNFHIFCIFYIFFVAAFLLLKKLKKKKKKLITNKYSIFNAKLPDLRITRLNKNDHLFCIILQYLLKQKDRDFMTIPVFLSLHPF